MRVLGRIEKLDFPDLNLYEIDSKIDTGAYTSSLHCHHIIRETHGDKQMVRFQLLDPAHPSYQDAEYLLPIHKEKVVKSSSGHGSKRIFVRTKILVFDDEFDIDLSLTDRSAMKYPVLIGRKALKGRFLVDVSLQNESYKAKKGSNV